MGVTIDPNSWDIGYQGGLAGQAEGMPARCGRFFILVRGDRGPGRAAEARGGQAASA
jgi:hypothetical protein